MFGHHADPDGMSELHLYLHTYIYIPILYTRTHTRIYCKKYAHTYANIHKHMYLDIHTALASSDTCAYPVFCAGEARPPRSLVAPTEYWLLTSGEQGEGSDNESGVCSYFTAYFLFYIDIGSTSLLEEGREESCRCRSSLLVCHIYTRQPLPLPPLSVFLL